MAFWDVCLNPETSSGATERARVYGQLCRNVGPGLTLDRTLLESAHLHHYPNQGLHSWSPSSVFISCGKTLSLSVKAESWSPARGRGWVFILPKGFEHPILLQIPPAESKGLGELEDLILLHEHLE